MTRRINHEVIQEIRKAYGANQTEFWTPLGVTQSAGSRYESGRALPRPVAMLFTMVYVDNANDAIKQLLNLRSSMFKDGGGSAA